MGGELELRAVERPGQILEGLNGLSVNGDQFVAKLEASLLRRGIRRDFARRQRRALLFPEHAVFHLGPRRPDRNIGNRQAKQRHNHGTQAERLMPVRICQAVIDREDARGVGSKGCSLITG